MNIICVENYLSKATQYKPGYRMNNFVGEIGEFERAIIRRLCVTCSQFKSHIAVLMESNCGYLTVLMTYTTIGSLL